MRPLQVAIAALLLIAGLGCAPGPSQVTQPPQVEEAAPSRAAPFRGYVAIDYDLRSRFLTGDDSFELAGYLGADTKDSVSRLLGRTDGFGVRNELRNLGPNGLNVMIWRVVLSRFTNQLAAACPQSQLRTPTLEPLALNARAQAVVLALCAWPQVDDAALTQAWQLGIGDWATPADEASFREWAHSPDLQGKSPDAALPSLWLAMFTHPAFLLQR